MVLINLNVKKMKNKSLILLVLFISFSTFSQTAIDIVRASNYYSKATSNYKSGNYGSALEKLKLAEDNLKGKTNRDLEYMKIMSNYRLKNFRKAYDLVKIYFEKGFSGRSKSFRNVTSYYKSENIDYEEELTSIFVNLEEKFNLVENVNVDEFIKKIVQKIKNKHVSFSSYIKYASQKSSFDLLEYYIRKSTYNRFGNIRNKSERARLTLNRYKISNDKVYYSGTLSGGAVSSSTFKINTTYKPITSYVNNNAYEYGYKYYNTRYVSGKVSFYKTVYSGRYENSSRFSSQSANNYFVKKLKNNNYTNSNYKLKKYKIYFTEDEKIVLNQDNNLLKLKTALKQEGLLK
jgi:hypothetical protein